MAFITASVVFLHQKDKKHEVLLQHLLIVIHKLLYFILIFIHLLKQRKKRNKKQLFLYRFSAKGLSFRIKVFFVRIVGLLLSFYKLKSQIKSFNQQQTELLPVTIFYSSSLISSNCSEFVYPQRNKTCFSFYETRSSLRLGVIKSCFNFLIKSHFREQLGHVPLLK